MIINTPTITPPTEDEIEITMSAIYDKLELPEMDLLKNAAVKEGLLEAIDVLADDKRDYKLISPGLKTDQGRSIGILAIDYLLGQQTDKALLAVHPQK